MWDVACGTGKHLKYLSKKFNCTGVDINQGILDIARKNVPTIKLIKADMVDMDLKEKYDIITCLFSSIGHVTSLNDFKKTMHKFSNHLQTGGIVIIEPWITQKSYKSGSVHMSTFDTKDLKIVRMNTNISDQERDLSILETHYLIGKRMKMLSITLKHTASEGSLSQHI